ncbi:carboxypeptidase-like regulatory domain-containing protein [Saccharicrinis aurantiacus]|uniref:carboxypeptidase-like regulatory domain-containing protein n=1 Tax=Saccharicrinis aurantiacus TaxID=1849719 RepID=UPI00248FE4B7|nr:carboxypeptidase-like regulatory domain-containing protein [Saccharicrinis aurantiacus]
MKNVPYTTVIKSLMILICLSAISIETSARSYFEDIGSDTINVVEYRAKIIDDDSGDPLMFASVGVVASNISTVSNSEGYFVIKVPEGMKNEASIKVSYLGYEEKIIKLSTLSENRNKIRLTSISVSLEGINVAPKDADEIMRNVLSRKHLNYMQTPLQVTAFYRETIQRRRSYVSLTEAIVDIYKQPYNNFRYDGVKLYKARKDADYSKMDTLSFKLQGGPYSTLMLDVMKDPYAILSYEDLDYYIFNVENVTKVKDRIIYVLSFVQKPYVTTPLFYGKLYIDAETLAVSSIAYSINISDKEEASAMFIKQKPAGAVVYPTEASYLVKYKQEGDKWMYSYSRGSITFKINWKKKLLSTNYTSTIEMAVTDWKIAEVKPFKANEKIKRNVILHDQVEGFRDDTFWGQYNVIEPEASIESVIKKIKKRLDKR